MKKLLLVVLLLISLFVLAACKGSSNQAATEDSANDSRDTISLSQVNMLLVGTLKLEDTDLAVSADVAEKLLPLWQAYRSLSTSQTAAEAEVDALLNQIENTMTADQVQAIKAMNLTNTDMINLMQSMGGGMVRGGTPNPQGIPSFDFPGGNFQPGSPPEGMQGNPPSGSTGGTTGNRPSGGGSAPGDGMPGGDAGIIVMGGGPDDVAGLGGPSLQGTLDPSMQATAEARFSTQASRVNSILLDILINKLEIKTTE